jgi:flavodoxin
MAMKSLVIYHSNYGNTKTIAETIAKELGKDARAVSASDFKTIDLGGIGALIVGSPIIGWKPSEPIGTILNNLGTDQLKDVKAASFDTRVKLFLHGDAANKISKVLKNAGAQIISSPEAFYVKGKEGPLFEGEVDRAKEWGKALKGKLV